jgi:tetratricopeptide (TPR) repeat protein
MKWVFFIAGICTVGWVLYGLFGDPGDKKALYETITEGNTHYRLGTYAYALMDYETLIDEDTMHPALLHNAAQASYALDEYERAAYYYEKAPESEVKYINYANAVRFMGDAAENDDERLDLYLFALSVYWDGIKAYPQNVPLKYNYESLLQLIDLIEEEKEEESEPQDSEEGEDSEASEDGEAGEDGESDENAEQMDASEDEQEDLTEEALERILQMLSKQEEQSLKNNREVKDAQESGKGW